MIIRAKHSEFNLILKGKEKEPKRDRKRQTDRQKQTGRWVGADIQSFEDK